MSKVVSVFLHPAWLSRVQHGVSEQSVKNALGLNGLPVSEAAPQVVEATFHSRAFFWLISWHCGTGNLGLTAAGAGVPPPDEVYHFLLVMNRIEFWKLGMGFDAR